MQNLETEPLLQNIPKDQLNRLIVQVLEKHVESQTERITIPELCLKHHQSVISRELAKHTIHNYEVSYRIFQKWADGRGLIYADEVRYDHSEEFYNYLLKTPELYSPNKFRKSRGLTFSRNTAILRYKYIKAMFQYALQRDHILKNPFPNKVIPTSPVTEWWDDYYVYNELIPAIRKYNKAGIRFKMETITKILYNTGWRIGIFLRTRRKDIKITEDNKVFITMDLKIQKSAEMTRITLEVIENNTRETIIKAVKRHDRAGRTSEERLFARSLPHSAYNAYRTALHRVCKKAGIKYLSPHKAKHGFVTKMAKNKLSAEQICKLTGNKTPELVRRVYMHLFFEDVAEEADKILNS